MTASVNLETVLPVLPQAGHARMSLGEASRVQHSSCFVSVAMSARGGDKLMIDSSYREENFVYHV